MNARALALLSVAGLALVTLAPGMADATTGNLSCATTSREGTSGTRFWMAETATPNQACDSSSDPRLLVAPGGTFTLTCTEWTTGLTPAEEASFVWVYLYHDGDSEGNPGAATGMVRNIDFGSSCAASPSVTAACTHDGQASGSPRHGIMRIVIRAQRNTLPTYSVNSDTDPTGTSGIIQCGLGLSTHTAASTSGLTPLVAGDTVRTTTAANAAPFATTGSTARVLAVCGSQENTATSAFLLSTTAVNHDKQITTPTSAWPDECTIQSKVNLTRKSAIPNLPNLDYTVFMGTPPAGTTYAADGLSATRDASRYDATLAVTLPTWAGPRCSGATSETFRIAVDLMALQPTDVRNARNEPVTYAKTFVENVTEYETGISIGERTFAGVTDATAPCATLSPSAPPSDHWRYNVTITDEHGGYVFAFKNVTFVAPTTNVNTSIEIDFEDDFTVGLLDDRLEGPAPYKGYIVTRGGSLVAQVAIDLGADGTYEAQYTGRSLLYAHEWTDPGVYPWVVKVLYNDGTTGYAYGETHVRSGYAKDPLTQPGGGVLGKGGLRITPSLVWDWLVGLALLAVACAVLYFRIIAGNG